MNTCEIISIGEELLSGLTVNTNASYIGFQLTGLGLDTRYVTTVGDRIEDIIQAFQKACNRSDIIISTGGLGPTDDDITKQAFARFLDKPLVIDQAVLHGIEDRFQKRGYKMSQTNKKQAEIPQSTEILNNPLGSAPGLYKFYHNSHIFILPGVPNELKAFFKEVITPRIKSMITDSIHYSKVIKTTAIPESKLAELLTDFPNQFPDIKLAFLPEFSGVKLRLMNKAGYKQTKSEFEQAIAYIYKNAALHIFGEDNDTLESVVVAQLIRKNKTLAIAESCTGGLISAKITNVPNSSACFNRAFVTYSNDAKNEHLNIPEDLLVQHGAVSEKIASMMADSVRKIAKTDYGLSVTGIAGPGGGTADKPVGLVYIGLATPETIIVKKYQFLFDRQMNREITAYRALNLLRLEINKII